MRSVVVEVPATSANVGPGYDAFGLALEIRNRFTARTADEWSVEVSGEGVESLPHDTSNRVALAMMRVFEIEGTPERAAYLLCENGIPPGAGLGSSAAAIVGGMVLADELAGGTLGRDRLLALAVEMEGHPDNVAAALCGGFAIGWRDENGTPHGTGLDPAGGLAVVVVAAEWELPTRVARKLLPDVVPHVDAAFNAGHAGLLAAGIATGDERLIAAGLADRLHQQYRLGAVPDLEAVSEALVEAGALGAVLSGAGPTVLGLVAGRADDDAFAAAVAVADRAQKIMQDRAECARRRKPQAFRIARSGIRILARG